MKYQYSYSKSLFVINRLLTKDIFLEKAGIEQGKYAEQMFTRIYDCIFSELINIEDQYQKYYKIEYSSLAVFLYQKYCIEQILINEIMDLKAQNNNYGFDNL